MKYITLNVGINSEGLQQCLYPYKPMALAHLWLWLRFEFGSSLALDQLWLWISFAFGSALA